MKIQGEKDTQSSIIKFGTRSNSFTLLVTNVTLMHCACAAIIKSNGPIGALFFQDTIVFVHNGKLPHHQMG